MLFVVSPCPTTARRQDKDNEERKETGDGDRGLVRDTTSVSITRFLTEVENIADPCEIQSAYPSFPSAGTDTESHYDGSIGKDDGENDR